MGDPTGEADKVALRLDFDRRLLLKFYGSTITSDAGLPLSPGTGVRANRSFTAVTQRLNAEEYIRSPAIRTTISSKCQRSLGQGRRWRSRRAIAGPNFSTQRRTVSYEISSPRSASSSSTSR